MLNEAGHQVTCFDPLFFPDQQSLQTIYDFITCTETAEHFHQPAVEFDRLIGLVRPGGFLGFMTCFQTDDDRFARWSYRRDITHVTFYREHTFRVLAEKLNCMCEVPTKDIVLLRKMETEATSQTQDVDNRSA
jgi:2-polyprenyl-3-methyl-5-hydroxy-6-metoxy-1,4-benzoquinol methylase